jgi:Matrixin
MKKNYLALAIVAIVVVASAAPADAYTLLSPRRVWKTTPVAIPTHNSPNATVSDSDGGVSAVVGAIKAWGIVNSSTTNTAAKKGQAPATIMLSTDGNTCKGTCLAATLIGYYHQEGSTYYIDDADVFTSERHAFYTSREGDGCAGEYDLDGVMVHEVGHVLGIGHSNVQGATMYPSVSACNTANRTLANDDTAAKNDLY